MAYLADPTHAAVMRIFEVEKRGNVLDVGAGDGSLTAALKAVGFYVSACDIDPSQFKVGDMPCKTVDLNKAWPYDDAAFDYVTAVEVIEHLENPMHMIREAKRVLRRGGKLVLTTPNIMNIFSRVKFLLVGSFFCFGSVERKSGHINPLTYWEIKEGLEREGFKVLNVNVNRYFGLGGEETKGLVFKRAASRAIYLLLRLLIRPSDRNLLAGDNLIFVAKKA